VNLLPNVLGSLSAVAAVLALSLASTFPVRVNPSSQSILRIAFSARPERVETCITPSAEELAELPQHMRQSVVCEGHSAAYRLEVHRDGQLLATASVHGGGLRQDRQLYVLEELPIPSGRSSIEVTLSRVDTLSGDDAGPDDAVTPSSGTGDSTASDTSIREERDAEQRRRRMADEVPSSLVFRETVELAPREVLLVTYDRGARRLQMVRGAR